MDTDSQSQRNRRPRIEYCSFMKNKPVRMVVALQSHQIEGKPISSIQKMIALSRDRETLSNSHRIYVVLALEVNNDATTTFAMPHIATASNTVICAFPSSNPSLSTSSVNPNLSAFSPPSLPECLGWTHGPVLPSTLPHHLLSI